MPINFRLTPAVKTILIALLSIFVLQHLSDQYFGGSVTATFGLVPSRTVLDFWFWQPFTYFFLHGDVLHLFLNMLMFVFVGCELESLWGSTKFTLYALFCSVFAAFLYLVLQIFTHSGFNTPMIGASGAIYGLLVAYGIIYSERVMLFMMLFPMKAKYFIWILAGVEFMTTLFSPHGGLSSVAHLSGMLGGFLYLWVSAYLLARRRLRESGFRLSPRQKANRSKNKHLKLVVSNNPKESLRKFDTDPDDDRSDDGRDTWH